MKEEMYSLCLLVEEVIDKMGEDSPTEESLIKLLEDSCILAETLKKHAKGVVERHYLRVQESNF